MESLADINDLLDKTTSGLMAQDEPLTAQSGISLIDRWIGPLSEGENTKPIAKELENLKRLLGEPNPDSSAIIAKMALLAGKVLILAPDIGSEGEMPSLLNALASALKMTENKD